jgi:hypothetical protein
MNGKEWACDGCGMLFERSALKMVSGERRCGFCIEENETKRDTWPSALPTEIPGLVEVGK